MGEEPNMSGAFFRVNKTACMISLFRTSGNIASSEMGLFYCIILDANDTNQTLHVNICELYKLEATLLTFTNNGPQLTSRSVMVEQPLWQEITIPLLAGWLVPMPWPTGGITLVMGL